MLYAHYDVGGESEFIVALKLSKSMLQRQKSMEHEAWQIIGQVGGPLARKMSALFKTLEQLGWNRGPGAL